MEEKPTYNSPEEEEGIDILALVKSLWAGRKTIIICTVIFMVLGLVAALTMKRTYTVNSVMVPQLGSSRNSSLSSLASLAGFDMGMNLSSGSELSPLVYPQIVSSITFRRELLYTPLHFQKADKPVSIYTYLKEYTKPTVMGTVLKYTVGLPGVILSKLRKEQPEVQLPEGAGGSGNGPKIVAVSREEKLMLDMISQCVGLSIDKKDGFLTLTVIGSEPLQTAELALKAQTLLQSEITRFRTEKAKNQLDYIQARYDEIKAETESYQSALAAITDRSQNMTTTRSRIEKDRLQSKYNVANSIYAEMAKQLEQAKMQVKRDTPVLAIIQPVTIPRQPSNSRAKKLIIWTFLGIMLGCGNVLGKEYLPKVKEMFSDTTSKEN